MVEKKTDKNQINEEEAVRAFLRFRSYPADKQAFAIAFINGMEFQRSISEAERPLTQEGTVI